MGRPYYYFAASLPMLALEGKLPMTVESFLEESRRLLAGDDFDLMYALLTEDDPRPSAKNAAFDAWARFNRSFRNELAWIRANQSSKDPLLYIRDLRSAEPLIADEIYQASKMANLLEAQLAVDKIVWRFLDNLAAGHYYDIEFLFAYGLKLKILERHQAYASGAGREVLRELKETKLPESCTLARGQSVGNNEDSLSSNLKV